MKPVGSFPVAIFFWAVCASAPVRAQAPQQAPTPRPDTPFSSKPAAPEQQARAERQFKAMQDIHRRFMSAKTAQERRALMAEHSRAMRSAMEALQGMQRDGVEHGAPMSGYQVQQQLAMMQMMMQMMMDRIDMLSEPATK